MSELIRVGLPVCKAQQSTVQLTSGLDPRDSVPIRTAEYPSQRNLEQRDYEHNLGAERR